MSYTLANIWPSPLSFAITFSVIGSTVTVTIASDCTDAATNIGLSDQLDVAPLIPLAYRPSGYRGSSSGATPHCRTPAITANGEASVPPRKAAPRTPGGAIGRGGALAQASERHVHSAYVNDPINSIRPWRIGFCFDREKAAHKSGALTGPKERNDCALR